MFQERSFSLLPALIGATAFSITTVVVMRREGFLWAKLIVPVFDFFLMFLGFNINYLFKDNSTNAFIWLSLFFSVFAAFITGVLGFINYKERKNESTHLESVNLMQKEIDSLRINISELQTTKIHLLDSNLQLENDIRQMSPKAEKWDRFIDSKRKNKDVIQITEN